MPVTDRRTQTSAARVTVRTVSLLRCWDTDRINTLRYMSATSASYSSTSKVLPHKTGNRGHVVRCLPTVNFQEKCKRPGNVKCEFCQVSTQRVSVRCREKEKTDKETNMHVHQHVRAYRFCFLTDWTLSVACRTLYTVYEFTNSYVKPLSQNLCWWFPFSMDP